MAHEPGLIREDGTLIRDEICGHVEISTADQCLVIPFDALKDDLKEDVLNHVLDAIEALLTANNHTPAPGVILEFEFNVHRHLAVGHG